MVDTNAAAAVIAVAVVAVAIAVAVAVARFQVFAPDYLVGGKNESFVGKQNLHLNMKSLFSSRIIRVRV